MTSLTPLPQNNTALAMKFLMAGVNGKLSLENVLVKRFDPKLVDPSARILHTETRHNWDAQELITYATDALNTSIGHDVRQLLDMNTRDVPNIETTEGTLPPQYEVLSENITFQMKDVAQRTQEDIDAHLAHHYAMHLVGQAYSKAFLMDCRYRSFREGIARGVEYAVQQLRGTPATASLRRSAHALLFAQKLINQPYRTQQGKRLAELLPALRQSLALHNNVLSDYAIGHALFTLKEEERGLKVYAQALRHPQVILE